MLLICDIAVCATCMRPLAASILFDQACWCANAGRTDSETAPPEARPEKESEMRPLLACSVSFCNRP
jgi:hypothetical protein